MQTIREMREKQRKLVEEAEELLEKAERAEGDEVRELDAKYDAAMAEFDELQRRIEQQQALERAQNELAELDDVTPPDVGNERVSKPEDAEVRGYGDVFRDFIRRGEAELSAEDRAIIRERRAQGVGTDSAGGYLAPDDFVARLVEVMKAFGPMVDPGVTEQLVTSDGRPLEIPTLDDTSNVGAILAENTADTEQDLTFGIVRLDAYKYSSKLIRVSTELLQDAQVDVEGIVRGAMGERIGRIVNQHLTVGTGSGQPNGIVTGSSAGVTAAANNAITFDELMDLMHSVDPAYRGSPRVRWMLHDTTLKAVRKLKDSNGQYIWDMGDVRGTAPATILGVPYVVNQDMPTIGSQTKSILFGDFSRYLVRRVRDVSIARLVERYAEYHQVGFVGIARYDGDILDSTAIKHLVHPL